MAVTRRERKITAVAALAAGAVASQAFTAAPGQSVGLQRAALRQVAVAGAAPAAAQAPSAIGVAGVSSALVAAAAAAANKRTARKARKARAVALNAVSYKTTFIFPGQGAQAVGMCEELVKDCPKAKEMFDKASEILGFDLLDICINGPKEKLNTTAVAQPAIFTASMAAIEKMRMEGSKVDDATATMGLSLGEYSALCFSGALSFEDGVRITKARGEAMQAAADAVESSMASVIGLDSEKTAALCEKASADTGKKVQIANFLCKGNYAVSGDKEAVEKVIEIAKPEFKARMAVPLAVAGAFHTDFMAPAVDALVEVLKAADVKEPRIPVISNVDGEPHRDPETIRATLAKQVTSPVQWETQMTNMLAGDFEEAFEVGPGKVCAGLLRRFDKKASMTNIEV